MSLRKIMFIEDIMDRYNTSISTARRYMHEMGAHGRPFFVYEDVVAEWELKHQRQEPIRKIKIRPVPVFNGEMIIPKRK